MQRLLLSALCAAALTLVASPTQAQTASGSGTTVAATPSPGTGTGGLGRRRPGAPGSPERHAHEILFKYDKDGDHALNATELAAFFADMHERAAGRLAAHAASGGTPAPAPTSATGVPAHGVPEQHAARAIAKFDKNGDGKLDAGELVAMLIAFRQQAKEKLAASQSPAPASGQQPQTHTAPATTIPSPSGN